MGIFKTGMPTFLIKESRVPMSDSSGLALQQLFRSSLSNLENRLLVNVVSNHNPSSNLLIAARSALKSSAKFSDIFNQFELDAENLAQHISTELLAINAGYKEDEIKEVAGYLADEYTQLGRGFFIVANDTGKVIAKITEKELYKPKPVPREGKSVLVDRPVEVRPEVKAFIYEWFFESRREQQLVEEKRVEVSNVSTSIAPILKSTRKELVSSLGSTIVEDFMAATPYCSVMGAQEPLQNRVELELVGRYKVSIADKKSLSGSFDFKSAISSQIVRGWWSQLLDYLVGLIDAETVVEAPWEYVVQRPSKVWFIGPNGQTIRDLGISSGFLQKNTLVPTLPFEHCLAVEPGSLAIVAGKEQLVQMEENGFWIVYGRLGVSLGFSKENYSTLVRICNREV